VCGILSLVSGGAIIVSLAYLFVSEDILSYFEYAYFYCSVIASLADSNLLFVLPLWAVIFGAVPLYQGQGTDWDGKGMAEAGLSTGTVTLLAFLLYYTGMSFMYMPGLMAG
jgi:hypothetical protein